MLQDKLVSQQSDFKALNITICKILQCVFSNIYICQWRLFNQTNMKPERNPPRRERARSLPNTRLWSSSKICHRYRLQGKCFLGSFCPYSHPGHHPIPRPIKAKKYVEKRPQSMPEEKLDIEMQLPLNFYQLPKLTYIPLFHTQSQSVPYYRQKIKSFRDQLRKEQIQGIMQNIRNKLINEQTFTSDNADSNPNSLSTARKSTIGVEKRMRRKRKHNSLVASLISYLRKFKHKQT